MPPKPKVNQQCRTTGVFDTHPTHGNKMMRGIYCFGGELGEYLLQEVTVRVFPSSLGIKSFSFASFLFNFSVPFHILTPIRRHIASKVEAMAAWI